MRGRARVRAPCGGSCVPGAPGPSGGARVPDSRPLVEYVGRVTGGSLQPTTESQRDSRGTRLRGRRKDLGRAEHFPAPGTPGRARSACLSPPRLGHRGQNGARRATPSADPSFVPEGGGGEGCFRREEGGGLETQGFVYLKWPQNGLLITIFYFSLQEFFWLEGGGVEPRGGGPPPSIFQILKQPWGGGGGHKPLDPPTPRRWADQFEVSVVERKCCFTNCPSRPLCHPLSSGFSCHNITGAPILDPLGGGMRWRGREAEGVFPEQQQKRLLAVGEAVVGQVLAQNDWEAVGGGGEGETLPSPFKRAPTPPPPRAPSPKHEALGGT